MAVIALNNFAGETPALSPSTLPENGAQLALNCDFTNQSLTPMKDGLYLNTFAATNPVKSLYTEDGIKFFTWTTDTYPFKGPIINDLYNRVYYLNGSTATVVDGSTASVSGGNPSTPYTVGVPTPLGLTGGPILGIMNRATLTDYPSAIFTFKAWYDLDGVRYDETDLATAGLINTVPLKEWTFTAPTSGTDGATQLVVECTLTDSSKVLFTMDTKVDATLPATTSALPGGIEMSLTNVSGSTYRISLSWGVMETRAYVYTVTNQWGEESAPSLPAIISPTYIQDVSVTTPVPSFTGYVPYGGTNVYRTFGSNSAYLRTGTAVSNPFTDSSKTPTGVTSSLISTDFYPPALGLSGFGVAPNGICWAFKGNTLYLSEPYRPHAWPYSQAFTTNIRGVCVGSQSIVVTTADGCFAVLGAHPAAMTQIKLPSPQAGLSTRSMTNVEGSVAFASNDGVVMVTGSQASLEFSHRYFNRSDWRGRYSSILSGGAIKLTFHDGCLVGTSNAGLGFIVRIDEGKSNFSQFNQIIDGAFYIPVLDTVYYSVGANVYQLRGHSNNLLATWWSKDFVMEYPINFAIGYIRCSGLTQITMYADGVQTTLNGSAFSVDLSAPGGYFRLPAGKRAVRWSVKVETYGTVYELYIASSMAELKNV